MAPFAISEKIEVTENTPIRIGTTKKNQQLVLFNSAKRRTARVAGFLSTLKI